jgi:hypothetical protein
MADDIPNHIEDGLTFVGRDRRHRVHDRRQKLHENAKPLH